MIIPQMWLRGPSKINNNNNSMIINLKCSLDPLSMINGFDRSTFWLLVSMFLVTAEH